MFQVLYFNNLVSASLIKTLTKFQQLSNGLFELRERRFGYRIYYCFGPHNTIILLAAGDKQSQEKDIKTARERLAIA